MTSTLGNNVNKMDVLYRFNVLNTAVSTIAKETADWILSMGSSWHFCLFIWTLYYGITDIRQDFFNIGPISAAMFICASLYLVFTDYTGKIFKFDILMYLSKACLYLSLPFVVILYVWQPLNKGVRCMLKRILGQCDEALSFNVSIVLAIIFSILLCIYNRKSRKSQEGTFVKESSVSPTAQPVRRRMSARILARQQRVQQRQQQQQRQPQRRHY